MPLADEATVKAWKEKEGAGQGGGALEEVHEAQTEEVGEMLAARTDEYLLAARGLAPAAGLDAETSSAWKQYLASPKKDHPFLKTWFEAEDEERDPRGSQRGSGRWSVRDYRREETCGQEERDHARVES